MSPKPDTSSLVSTEEPIQRKDDPLSTLVLPERPPPDHLRPAMEVHSEFETSSIQIPGHSPFQETIRYSSEAELPRIGDLPRDLSTSDVLGTFSISLSNESSTLDTDQTPTTSPQVRSINQSLFMLRQFVSLTSAWPANSQQSVAASLTYDPTNRRFRLEYIQSSQQSSLAGSSRSQLGVFAEQSDSGTGLGVILPLGGPPESSGRLGSFNQQLASFLEFYKETFAGLPPDKQQQLRENALAILDSSIRDLESLASQTQSDQQRDFASAFAEQMRETRNQIGNVR